MSRFMQIVRGFAVGITFGILVAFAYTQGESEVVEPVESFAVPIVHEFHPLVPGDVLCLHKSAHTSPLDACLHEKLLMSLRAEPSDLTSEDRSFDQAWSACQHLLPEHE